MTTTEEKSLFKPGEIVFLRDHPGHPPMRVDEVVGGKAACSWIADGVYTEDTFGVEAIAPVGGERIADSNQALHFLGDILRAVEEALARGDEVTLVRKLCRVPVDVTQVAVDGGETLCGGQTIGIRIVKIEYAGSGLIHE